MSKTCIYKDNLKSSYASNYNVENSYLSILRVANWKYKTSVIPLNHPPKNLPSINPIKTQHLPNF